MAQKMTNKDYDDENSNLKLYENGDKEFTDEAFYVMLRHFNLYKVDDLPSFYYKSRLTGRLEALMIMFISKKNDEKTK